MKTIDIAIIGAGMSGLYAAHLLRQQGMHDFVLIEARDVVGGRIASFTMASKPGEAGNPASRPNDTFDLGPAWFWPDFQPQLSRLLDALGLERFAQFEFGDTLVERAASGGAIRVAGIVNSPASMRLVGGMGALIAALHQGLDQTRIMTGQAIRRMRVEDACVELEIGDRAGAGTGWRARHVLLALPPRLAQASIEFIPALPQILARQWQSTATWMAQHAKYLAIYDRPFWREQGLSGEARSTRGPLAEIHDASMPGGSGALFGFLGVPADLRERVPEDVLRAHCRAQLVRLFGEEAAAPRAECFKDWAQDPFTATRADLVGDPRHPEAPAPTAASGSWSGRLTGIGSEWSPHFPGYLAGALEAATIGVLGLA